MDIIKQIKLYFFIYFILIEFFLFKGRPIYIEILSKIDLNRLFQLIDEKNLELYYIREYERLMKYRYYACSKASGTLIEQSISILDLKGVGMGLIVGKVCLLIENFFILYFLY